MKTIVIGRFPLRKLNGDILPGVASVIHFVVNPRIVEGGVSRLNKLKNP